MLNASRQANGDDQCSDEPEHCTGPNFQIHDLEAPVNQRLELLDEVHFSYASKAGGSPKFLSGDLYSGAFLRTQYYIRLEEKFSVNSKKTGKTSGPFACPAEKEWSLMQVDERAACGQSSFTLFKKLDPNSFLDVPLVPVRNLEEEEPRLPTGRQSSSGRMQEIGGAPVHELTGDDAPLYADESNGKRNRA